MDKLIEKMRPQMYCFVGSEMLTNTFNEKEQIRNAEICANITKEIACGFAEWLLCFYNTSEEGMSLCWHDVENKTKHDTKELFDLYIKSL